MPKGSGNDVHSEQVPLARPFSFPASLSSGPNPNLLASDCSPLSHACRFTMCHFLVMSG